MVVVGFRKPQNRMEIQCAYCGSIHSHSIIDGYRVPHCHEHPKKKDYFIQLNYLDKLKMGVITPDYDELLNDSKLLLRAYKQSFQLHSEVKEILHKVEERPGVPFEIFKKIGTERIAGILNWLVDGEDLS